MFRLLILAILTFSLAACQIPEGSGGMGKGKRSAFAKIPCDVSQAYNAGVNDARNGHTMREEFPMECSSFFKPKMENERKEYGNSYRKGYEFGMSTRAIERIVDRIGNPMDHPSTRTDL